MNRKIGLVGRIDVLQEDAKIRKKDLDFFPEERMSYPDLVFTLSQDNTKYFRPQVKLENEKLVVVANNAFFRAARDAGMEEIWFDLLVSNQGKPLPLGYVQDLYDLTFAPDSLQKNFMNKFYFFHRYPKGVDCSDLRAYLNPKSDSQVYKEHQCLNYRLDLEGSPKRIRDLIERLTARNGQIKSIDGIKMM